MAADVLSSDEEQPVLPVQPRLRQRSLRRKKTTRPSSKQLVSITSGIHAHPVCHPEVVSKLCHFSSFVISLHLWQENLRLKSGANEIVFSITTKYQVRLCVTGMLASPLALDITSSTLSPSADFPLKLSLNLDLHVVAILFSKHAATQPHTCMDHQDQTWYILYAS